MCISQLDDLGEDRDKGNEDLINEDDIEADLEEFCIEEKDGSVQVPSDSINGRGSEPKLDLSGLHQQMETNEPISFMAALHAQVSRDVQSITWTKANWVFHELLILMQFDVGY